MNRIKVSVIVPIYNVGKYIERCVRSLMEQTLDEVEYIFVDDCTPDDSMEILRRVIADYPGRCGYIKILRHERNQGSATVRNTGLASAAGEYVIHCDSDDWVEPDMYEAMYRAAKAEDADVVGTDFYNEYAGRSVLQRQPFPDTNVECVRRMLSSNLHCGTWNKLVRRDIYIRNNIHFPDGINMWEDVLIMIPVCYHASKIVYLPRAFYHYVQYNSDSYTRQMSDRSLRNMVEAVDRLESFLADNHLDDFHKELCYTKLTVKLNLLLNSSESQRHKWSRIYPEADAYLSSYSAMSIYWQLALKFAVWNLLPLFNLMAWIGKRFK